MIQGKILSSVLVGLGVLLVPFLWSAERAAPEMWHNRLLVPQFETEPQRHSPRFSTGLFLPTEITSSLTITSADNPVLIANPVYIAPGVTVTIEAGTHIYVHEFALITVAGSLILRGQAAEPITFSSNEQHLDNQHWGGLIFSPDSQGLLDYVVINNASPSVTCQRDSALVASHSIFQFGLLGLYTASPDCQLVHSHIRAVREGVVAVGIEPALHDTQVSGRLQPIRRTGTPKP